MGIGFRELIVILIIVVLVFGARKVPSIMGDFAKGIRSFKDGLKGEGEDEKTEDASSKSPSSLPNDKDKPQA